jgi:dual specificity MAP kinase phosphatase
MATIAIPRPIPSHRPEATLDHPATPPLSLDSFNNAPADSQSHPPVPNKHIPVCPSGPSSAEHPDTPPESPRTIDECTQKSLLHPPDAFPCLNSGPYHIYEVEAADVAAAMDAAARQPLPDPNLVFPWLHGLHPHNETQQSFFNVRKRRHHKPPTCLRGVTVVKADGDLDVGRLKGALSPDELIHRGAISEFVEADPREGFSVRNFHIQLIKSALLSDIIVYGEDTRKVKQVAWEVAEAQRRWREKTVFGDDAFPEYNTFFCTSHFSEFEEDHAEIVAVDSRGNCTGKVIDLVHQERLEMWTMSEASEISHNVFLGPTPELGSPEEKKFDILIECCDGGRLNPVALQLVAESLSDTITQPFHDFPSSGSILAPTWSHTEADGILETCKWIYHLSHGTRPLGRPSFDSEGDLSMSSDGEWVDEEVVITPRKILIHCADGYTESTMLGVAYHSYSTGHPVPEAWLDLHTTLGRNLFAYPSDVALLTSIAPRLLTESPVCAGRSLIEITNMVRNEPGWLPGWDGSFPSRILDYMYLGNLSHANNPDLLRTLGITQILSVGETPLWRDGDAEAWGEDNICRVQGVQDNGIDPLMDQFKRCLDFIGETSPCSAVQNRNVIS